MTRSTQHPSYQAFLSFLRDERKSKGVTQVSLAEKLGNRQTFISKLENGERRLDVIELLEYLEAIGSDAATFVSQLKRQIKSTSKKRDRKLAIREVRVTKHKT